MSGACSFPPVKGFIVKKKIVQGEICNESKKVPWIQTSIDLHALNANEKWPLNRKPMESVWSLLELGHLIAVS